MSQTRNMPIQVITRSAILLALVLASQALHLPQTCYRSFGQCSVGIFMFGR